MKLPLFYKGKMHDAYLSHVKVQITAPRKDIYLVLVYGLTEYPMMLATNKEIKSKDDVIKVAKLYFSRWKIEEYFRCKKQIFQFENFRVRKLKANQCIKFLSHFVHGISGTYSYETGNECTEGCNHTDRRSGQRQNSVLLLSAGKRYLRHTFVCERRHQALVQDKVSCIPSTKWQKTLKFKSCWKYE